MPLVVLSDGTTPRRTDARWPILVKWLTSIQSNNGLIAIAKNDPRRDDTRRILFEKILCALTGTTYNG